jgi:digeranylgeranylglycerophospholipid reductase
MDEMTSPGNSQADVVVVGGGPAGLSAAAEAAKGGLSVVVLERGHAIGEPVRTSGGSFVKPLKALGVPKRCYHPIHRIKVIGPTTAATKSYRRAVGCVIDVRGTYQWLAQQAVEAGAEIRLKAHVEGPRQRGRGVLVRDSFRGRYELPARVVVDASGHTGFLARDAGLRPGNARSAVGMEVELHAPGYDQDEVIFWLGDEDWDRVIRRMDALTSRQAAAVFASSFSPWWAASVVFTDPSLVRSVARALRSRRA